MLHKQHQDPAVREEVGKKGKSMPGVPRIRSDIDFLLFFPPQRWALSNICEPFPSPCAGPTPAVPNSNFQVCLQSSPTHSPGQMDQGLFSARDRAQGYLGTWSIIALQSLPAALKISTPPQHADTPIFIQKCILEAEAKSSTGHCGLKKEQLQGK